MSILDDLLAAIGQGSVEVVDLTASLSARTPVLQLPEPFAPGVGGRARGAPRGRLAPLPHRLGRPRPRPGGVPQRQRHRVAHARCIGRVRPLAGRGDPDRRHRGGDGGHRRRGGPLLRPALPLPRLLPRRRQVRPDPAPKPGPPAPHRSRAHRGPPAHRARLGEPGPSPGPGPPPVVIPKRPSDGRAFGATSRTDARRSERLGCQVAAGATRRAIARWHQAGTRS